MTPAAREIIRGLAGGFTFLGAWLLLAMPWWLAGVVGAGVYAATALLLPVRSTQKEEASVAPGVTAQERDEFVNQCTASVTALKQAAAQLPEGEFRSRVSHLAQTISSLASYVQRHPESLLAAMAVPRNLDHLLRMLRQYLELRQYPSPGSTVTDALQKVEETVGNAATAFEGMYQQLLDNDVSALQASATSLEVLLGVQSELDRARRKRETGRLPDLHPPAAPPVQTRPRQTEKPL